VAEQGVARGENAPADRGLPVGVGGRRLDLADDDVDHAVEQLLLVGHVLVEGHRHDVERLRQVAHADRVEAGLVGERDRGPQHALPIQRGSPFAFDHLRSSLDRCTSYALSYRPRCTSYTLVETEPAK
jgi:hypothetical protein